MKTATPIISFAALPALAMQGPAMAGNAPVLYQGASLHVGADVAPGHGALSPAGRHGDVRVSHGRAADGEGAAELIAYLGSIPVGGGIVRGALFGPLIGYP